MWRMRYYYAKEPGQRKADSQAMDLNGAGDAADSVRNLVGNGRVTRIDIVSKNYEADVVPVPVKRIEWEQDPAYPKGERWTGKVNGKLVATVTQLDQTWGGKCTHYLEVGAFGPGHSYCSSIESGKKAAQTAFNKIVRSLVGGAT